MGWLITLGILILLAVLPLGIHIQYDEDGAAGSLVAGPLRIRLFPRPKKPKPEKPKEKKPKKTPPPRDPVPDASRRPRPVTPELAPAEPKKGGSVTDFLPLVKIALDLLDGLRRKLRVDLLECKIILAGDDPCDLAVNYGRAWAALGNLLPRLERVLVIKKRDLNIECDFCGNKTLIYARVQITITLGRLLGLVCYHGFRALRKLLPILKQRKGGNVK